MTDNRRIDRLVAEHVMGLRIYHYDKDHADSCYYMLVDENCDYAGDDFGRHAGERDSEADAWEKDCPYYSSEISAAWEVVEKLTDGHRRAVEVGNGHSSWWWCNVSRPEPDSHGCTHYDLTKADTAPLAICLAALKAKGIAV